MKNSINSGHASTFSLVGFILFALFNWTNSFADTVTDTDFIAHDITQTSSGAQGTDLKGLIDIFGFSLGEDNKEVFFEFGGDNDGKDSYFKFTATIPVDQSDPELKLGDLNELRNKARFEVAWQKKLSGSPSNSLIDGAQPERPTPETGYLMGSDTLRGLVDRDKLNEPYWLFGLKGTLAYKRSSFYSASDLSNQLSETNVDYSASAYLAYQRSDKYHITATFSHVDSHRDQSKQEICSPFGDAGATVCSDRAIGAPIQSTSTLAALTYSQRFKEIGLQVKVTHNFDTDVTGISAPIWIKQDALGSLKAGVRLDWNSDKEDLVATLFFNKPYELPRFGR
ncbi:MAG: hypothetical protein AAF431_13440 [Pseudomonadota bacterium]